MRSRIEREKCQFGKSCMNYDVKTTRESLNRIINLLITNLSVYDKNKIEIIRLLNQIRKIDLEMHKMIKKESGI